jgi:hypothetical protein
MIQLSDLQTCMRNAPMKSAAAALGLAMLLPLAAFAESEYSACMKSQGKLGGTPDVHQLSPSARAVPAVPVFARVDGYYANGNYQDYGDTQVYSSFSGASLSFARGGLGASSQVSAMSRNCRHLVKAPPRAFRVVTVKSPSLRTTVNKSR